MPAPDELFAMHLADMRLRGLAEDTTIYARRCAIARLADWLAGNDPQVSEFNRLDEQLQQQNRLENATNADLLAWRTALTVSPKSVGPYVDHIPGYYAWPARNGHRADQPAAGLPGPPAPPSPAPPIKEHELWR